MVDGCVNDMDDPGLVLGEGLGFFPWGMVDQHFIQRGRLGRLIVAMQKCGYTYGFGVDENTGMFIDGRLMQVRGETGIMVVDLSQAECRDRDFRGVRISYLDDGDAYDLARHRALPHRSKKRIRVTKSSFSSPAPFQRNAFGAYALHELMIRLMKGNPSKYRKDSASAYDPREEKEVVVEMERLPRRSRALRSTRPDGAHRYTAVNFQIHMRTATQTRADRRAVKEDYAARMFESRPPAAEARLIVLGNSPIEWSPENAGPLMEHIREPVGIIASAAADPVTTAREYEEWLRKKGVRNLERFDIVSWNVDRFGRDREVLERLASSRTLIFTGGNQRRLVETLLHRGEATTVLQAIANAYHHGATLMAVSGSASAICTSMIAEGSSHEALLFGASTDAGHEGMVIEEGFGLFKIGIVDQNLISRRRLGRLIVACAEEQSRFGFGLCEESGMVLSEASAPVHAIGQHGFVVAALDPTKTSLGSDSFTAREVKLCFVQAGESFDPRSGQVIGVREPQLSVSAVERLVTDLARDCDATLHFGASQVRSKLIELRFKPDADGTALLDIETHRVRA
jgi:cyanophycinase